jgi:hypothetical protein
VEKIVLDFGSQQAPVQSLDVVTEKAILQTWREFLDMDGLIAYSLPGWTLMAGITFVSGQSCTASRPGKGIANRSDTDD